MCCSYWEPGLWLSKKRQTGNEKSQERSSGDGFELEVWEWTHDFLNMHMLMYMRHYKYIPVNMLLWNWFSVTKYGNNFNNTVFLVVLSSVQSSLDTLNKQEMSSFVTLKTLLITYYEYSKCSHSHKMYEMLISRIAFYLEIIVEWQKVTSVIVIIYINL